MAIVLNEVKDLTGLMRYQGPQDVAAIAETLGTLTTAGAGTITGALFNNSILSRTGPTGAYTDTTDTAANIVNALIGGVYNTSAESGASIGIPSGSTYRLRYINTVGFAMTLAAGTGVTLGTNTGIALSSWRDYLITITNGTPSQIGTGSITNANNIVTNMSQQLLSLLTPGMLVSGTGISAGTTVAAINVTAGTVQLSANATATNSLVALTFSPTLTIQGIGQGSL